MRNSFWNGFFIFAILAILGVLVYCNWSSISAIFSKPKGVVTTATQTIAFIHLF